MPRNYNEVSLILAYTDTTSYRYRIGSAHVDTATSHCCYRWRFQLDEKPVFNNRRAETKNF